jgi:GTP-binding protein Era
MLRLSRKFPICRANFFGSYSQNIHLRHLGSSSEESSSSSEKSTRRRLDVALVGAPNAGKSQLLNVMTQSPVAAVSRKRHTTRSDILGARTIDKTQIVFKDTPGFLRLENAKEERLDRELIVNAASEIQHVDYTLLVVDAARILSDNYRHALVQLMMMATNSKGRIEEDFEELVDEDSEPANTDESLARRSKFAIVLNKVDLVKPKSKLLEIAMDIGSMADAILLDQYRQKDAEDEESDELDFETMMELAPIVFYVSALEESGTEEIVEHLLSLGTPCRTWAVAEGQSTNMTDEEHVQEMIREKIYRCLHQELPHSVQQVNRLFRKVPQGMVIHQDLVVFTKSHHKLVLGSGGRTLQRIQDSAARDLGKLFECDVMLRLHVKLSKSKQKRSPEDYSQGESSQSVH